MDRTNNQTCLQQSKKQTAVFTGQLTRLDYERGAKYAETLHKWADEYLRKNPAIMRNHR